MPIDKILFERTGGFAGIRLAAEIEMDELPEDEKREIQELLDEADFDELPENISSKMLMPDGFVYSITVKSSEKEHRVITSEASLPDNLQPLIEKLESIAKSRLRKK